MTNAISKIETVVLAVHALGGSEASVDTEDVAVVAHKLQAEHFAWKKYHQNINLEMVRVTLSDAKKEKNGSLLSGNGVSGWRLTSAGQGAVAELLRDNDLREVVEDPAIFIQLPGEIPAGSRAAIERQRILSTHAWHEWKRGVRSIAEADAKAVFRIDAYTVGGRLAAKIERLREMFRSDVEVRRFLEHVSAQLLEKGQ